MADKKSLKGTKTEKNLANAFVAETTAYARYTYFAQTAQKELYFHLQISLRRLLQMSFITPRYF